MAKEQSFEALMQAERERLTKEREEIFNQQQSLEERLTAINNELRAFDVFEQAKQGKFPTTTAAPSKARASTGTRKGREGGKRDEILKLVQELGGGTRAELIEKLGVKGNKSGEQSLSNALSNLKKQGKVTQDESGKYLVAA